MSDCTYYHNNKDLNAYGYINISLTMKISVSNFNMIATSLLVLLLVGTVVSTTIGDESSCNKLGDKDTCVKGVDDTTNAPCTWCIAGAIPSECMSQQQAQLLPAGVFDCINPGSIENKQQEQQLRYHHTVKSHSGTNNKTYHLRTKENEQGTSDICDSQSKSISGYMDIKGSQYDESGENKHLFFWMFEKRGEINATTPFVIWLTGGPGCSSSLALLTENGPCSVNKDGKATSINQYSWTEAAHVLWLDQPAGVGFSYGEETDTNEEMVGEDAYYFLQAFFQTYPEYQNNPLYITGESYAGHYVPAISHRVWLGNKLPQPGTVKLNLAGIAIGNGLTDPELQYPAYVQMMSNNSHNIKIVDDDTVAAMEMIVPKCVALIHQCNAGDSFIDTFACQTAFLVCNAGLTSPYQMTGLNPYDIRIPCEKPPLCYDFSNVQTFLNLQSTRTALNVDNKHSHNWDSCNFGINMKFHTDWMKSFSSYVADLLNDGIPALIYAGDVDYICNYLGNRAWTLNLEWDSKDEFNTVSDHDWKGKGLARTADGLTFLQVYDAGHMVPSDQPEVALDMLTTFLAQTSF